MSYLNCWWVADFSADPLNETTHLKGYRALRSEKQLGGTLLSGLESPSFINDRKRSRPSFPSSDLAGEGYSLAETTLIPASAEVNLPRSH
jgi:hypothetical protein